MDMITNWLEQGQAIAIGWLTSPAAYAQFGLLLGSFIIALFLTRALNPRLTKLLTPAEDDASMLAALRGFGLLFLPLLLPLVAYALTAGGEAVTRSLFGSGAVIAFGKRIFIFLAARILVEKILYSPFLKTIGKYVLVPVAALYAFGLLGPISNWLSSVTLGLGAIQISADKLVIGAISGAFLFWFGRWSNDRGTNYIRQQEDMRPSVRELAAKTFEFIIYAGIFFLLMNIMGVPLTSLAVIGGAVGVGVGFGLQKIASNFVSGLILLLEGQATVGDYVELDGGEMGKIVRMMTRATILETFDGRWIVIPNEDFITTRVINYSDSGSANRYAVQFSVSYDTDINRIPDIVGPAVASHPDVLSEPEEPDVELAGFGDSGVEFQVEFWVNGIDDGENKYSSDVLFLIWNALKEHDITIPYPQREVRILGDNKAA